MASAPSRRMGAPDSKTRSQLLDAAEALLIAEGYAAVTSRRLAAKAGLKPQLVHYYFRSMDDLFIEVFRRRADENVRRVENLIAADSSLGALWAVEADPRSPTFLIEFVALANHRKAIRAEIALYAERFRSIQLDAVTAALEAVGIEGDQLPPIVALMMMTGLSQIIAIETALGFTTGHDTTVSFVEQAIERLDASRR